MQIELSCPCCACRFVAPPEAPSQEIWQQMTEDAPSYLLGDGETFEDMIFATLADSGEIRCPRCDEPMTVCEESLGRMAMELLAQW